MMRTLSWGEFLNSKNKINESLEDSFKGGATLLTGDFKKPNTTGVRQDAESSNNPKHYDELKKFLDGRNKPEKTVEKEGWFVTNEVGQYWIEDHWDLINNSEDAIKALLASEQAAALLAEYISGIVITLDKVPEDIRKLVS